jgi:hypothetical protein
MKTNRLVAGAAGAALAASTLVVAAPAHADVSVATAATLTSSKNVYIYGDTIFFDSAVTTADPNHPYAAGTATLYMLRNGSSTWEPVSTDDSVSYLYFEDMKAVQNATYKVVYPGGSESTYSSGVVTYLPSESAPFTVKVARKITRPSSGLVLRGKVTPKYKKKKIIVKVSKREKRGYKKFRVIRTNNRGRYRIALPKRRGTWYWQVIVPGDKRFIKNGYGWKTWTY